MSTLLILAAAWIFCDILGAYWYAGRRKAITYTTGYAVTTTLTRGAIVAILMTAAIGGVTP